MVFEMLRLAPHPDTYVLTPLVQPCYLISTRSSRVDDHFFTVELAGHSDGLLARYHALDREQLLGRQALLRRPVAADRDGVAVAVPCALHRVEGRHLRATRSTLGTRDLAVLAAFIYHDIINTWLCIINVRWCDSMAH